MELVVTVVIGVLIAAYLKRSIDALPPFIACRHEQPSEPIYDVGAEWRARAEAQWKAELRCTKHAYLRSIKCGHEFFPSLRCKCGMDASEYYMLFDSADTLDVEDLCQFHPAFIAACQKHNITPSVAAAMCKENRLKMIDERVARWSATNNSEVT